MVQLQAARNIISGNAVAGVAIESNWNQIHGNFIGTDKTGLNPLENQSGVLIYNKYLTVIGNKIGGTSVSARNIISGNQRGIVLASGVNSVIEGNFIGTDISGTTSLPNTAQGIHLLGDSLNIIGSNVRGSANVISGNIGNGLLIESANSNTIEGNFIGLQLNGVSPLGNSKSGIMVNRGNASDATCLGNRLIGNSINYNDSLGINLDGGNEIVYDVTSNDFSDTDTGPNNFKTILFLQMLKLILEHLSPARSIVLQILLYELISIQVRLAIPLVMVKDKPQLDGQKLLPMQMVMQIFILQLDLSLLLVM